MASVALAAAALLAACGSGNPEAVANEDDASGERETLRVGYQKYGWETVLKLRGTPGLEVEWAEFPTGPALMEALQSGAIDVGEVGEAPPVFARAAGIDYRVIAATGPRPEAEVVLLPPGSPITEVADLRGKTVALNKGSNVHYFLLRLLEAHGIELEEVEVVYLPPADARSAFAAGEVDAWVIWDPFAALAEHDLDATVLVDGTDLVGNNSYFVASAGAVEEKSEELTEFVRQLDDAVEWGTQFPDERAEQLAPVVGMPVEPLRTAAHRTSDRLLTDLAEIEDVQQDIADAFHEAGLFPEALDMEGTVVPEISEEALR